MAKIECQFAYSRSTKRTNVFEEVGSVHIGTLYVQKTSFPEQPKKLKVTVEVVE